MSDFTSSPCLTIVFSMLISITFICQILTYGYYFYRYRSLYNYSPRNGDELELREGDIVHVIEKCADGWFVGTSGRTGMFGTFPGNYVTPI